MNCAICGCPDHKEINRSVPQDKINKFGRREISFTVDSETIVSYGKDGLYHCKNCGSSFTFQEAVLGSKIPKDPQTKLEVKNIV